MAEDDRVEAVYTFFYAWFGFTLAVFPLVATVDSTAFGGSLGSLVVLASSVVVTIPAALEFLFSDRDPRLVGTFVVVFVVLFFLAIVLQAVVYVAFELGDSIPAVEFVLLLVTYVAAYALVYRGGLDRLKGTLTR